MENMTGEGFALKEKQSPGVVRIGGFSPKKTIKEQRVASILEVETKPKLRKKARMGKGFRVNRIHEKKKEVLPSTLVPEAEVKQKIRKQTRVGKGFKPKKIRIGAEKETKEHDFAISSVKKTEPSLPLIAREEEKTTDVVMEIPVEAPVEEDQAGEPLMEREIGVGTSGEDLEISEGGLVEEPGEIAESGPELESESEPVSESEPGPEPEPGPELPITPFSPETIKTQIEDLATCDINVLAKAIEVRTDWWLRMGGAGSFYKRELEPLEEEMNKRTRGVSRLTTEVNWICDEALTNLASDVAKDKLNEAMVSIGLAENGRDEIQETETETLVFVDELIKKAKTQCEKIRDEMERIKDLDPDLISPKLIGKDKPEDGEPPKPKDVKRATLSLKKWNIQDLDESIEKRKKKLEEETDKHAYYKKQIEPLEAELSQRTYYVSFWTTEAFRACEKAKVVNNIEEKKEKLLDAIKNVKFAEGRRKFIPKKETEVLVFVNKLISQAKAQCVEIRGGMESIKDSNSGLKQFVLPDLVWRDEDEADVSKED